MSGFSAQDVAKMLGVTSERVRSYVRAGLLSPTRGDRGELRFSFQDLRLLRTAEGLVANRIAPRRVRDAFKKLRDRAPERPLTGVAIAADGNWIVVREGDARWKPESGQVLLDFTRGSAELGAVAEALAISPLRTPLPVDAATVAGEEPRITLTAAELYEIGCELEAHEPKQAERAYLRAVELDPTLADAHVNLGRLLHERGDVTRAELHYRKSLELRPNDPTAAFNLGVALEDLGDVTGALDVYERAVTMDPPNPDAHYNAARLYEAIGQYKAAVRHLRMYRDLTMGVAQSGRGKAPPDRETE